MRRAHRPGEAYNPKSRDHILVGPNSLLYSARSSKLGVQLSRWGPREIRGALTILRNDPTGEKAYLEALDRGEGEATARRIQNWTYERANLMRGLIKEIKKIPANAVIFTTDGKRDEASAIVRLINGVRETDVNNLVLHSIPTSKNISLERANKARQRMFEEEARAKMLLAKRARAYRSLARSRVTDLAYYKMVAEHYDQAIVSSQRKAILLSEKADAIEQRLYKDMRSAFRGMSPSGRAVSINIIADLGAKARKRIDELNSARKAMEGMIRNNVTLADKLQRFWNRAQANFSRNKGNNASLEAYLRGHFPPLDPLGGNVRNWNRGITLQTLARDLGISVQDAELISNPDAILGKITHLRGEAEKLKLGLERQIKLQVHRAQTEVQHESFLSAYTRRGVLSHEGVLLDKVVDYDKATLDARRWYNKFLLSEKNDQRVRKGMWEYIGINLSDKRHLQGFREFLKAGFSAKGVEEIVHLAQQPLSEKEHPDERFPTGRLRMPAWRNRPFKSSIQGSLITYSMNPQIGPPRKPLPNFISTNKTAYYTRKRFIDLRGSVGPRVKEEQTFPVTKLARVKGVGMVAYTHYEQHIVNHPQYASYSASQYVRDRFNYIRSSKLVRRSPPKAAIPFYRIDLRGGLTTIHDLYDRRDEGGFTYSPHLYSDYRGKTAYGLRKLYTLKRDDLYQNEGGSRVSPYHYSGPQSHQEYYKGRFLGGRQYSGYGVGNANEDYLDYVSAQDWERRNLASMPMAEWNPFIAAKYWPRWKPTNKIFFSFGDDTSGLKKDPGFRTVQDLMNNPDRIVSSRYSYGQKRKGIRRGEVDVRVDDDTIWTYQILPDQRLRRVIKGPWKTFNQIFSDIQTANKPEDIMKAFKKTFHYLSPGGLDKVLGTDPELGPVTNKDLHPAARKLLRAGLTRMKLLLPSDSPFQNMFSDLDAAIMGSVDSANFTAKMIRQLHVSGWDQAKQYHEALMRYGAQGMKRVEVIDPESGQRMLASDLFQMSDDERFAVKPMTSTIEKIAHSSKLTERSAAYSVVRPDRRRKMKPFSKD